MSLYLKKLKMLKKPLPTLKEARQEEARRSLLDFTLYTKPDYYVNWHHEVLCDVLDEFIKDSKFNRLMVFQPPRTGKTELVSRRLPAFAFGLNPNIQIMACSYASTLSQRTNRDVQRIIDGKKYKALFPDSQLFGKNVRSVAGGSFLRNSDIFEMVDKKGVYVSAGVDGAITGMGFDIGIIDDPYKNWRDAHSPTIQKHVWEWYTSTFYTREEKGGKILLTLTRWHEEDLAGKLLKMAEEDPEAEQWKILCFPMIKEGDEKYIFSEDKREVGEVLWPWKYDKKKVKKIKKTLGTYLFNAMHQQKPAPPEGSILQRSWWKFYRELPGSFDEIIESWDCSFKDTKTSCYVVGQVWGRMGPDKYLLDQVRDKMDFPTTLQAIKTLSAKWTKAYTKLIEDKANGPAVISVLKKDLPGIIPINPDGGKIVRAHAVSGDIESGNVYIPDPSLAPWVHDFIEECAAFPNASNDDQVDAATQALNYLRSSFEKLQVHTSGKRKALKQTDNYVKSPIKATGIEQVKKTGRRSRRKNSLTEGY